MITSKNIQESRNVADSYICTRTPEPVLTYKENAKKHKKVVFPTGLVCNSNGEPFILDTGSASVLVLQRGSVAKMAVIGCYMKPGEENYEVETALKVTKLRFSNHLNDFIINKDTLFVVDAGRHEIVVIPKVGYNISTR